jgi:hypothetical protein
MPLHRGATLNCGSRCPIGHFVNTHHLLNAFSSEGFAKET